MHLYLSQPCLPLRPQGAPASPLPLLALSCPPDLAGGRRGDGLFIPPRPVCIFPGAGPAPPARVSLGLPSRGRQALGRRPRGPRKKPPSKDPCTRHLTGAMAAAANDHDATQVRRGYTPTPHAAPAPEARWALKGRRVWQRGGRTRLVPAASPLSSPEACDVGLATPCLEVGPSAPGAPLRLGVTPGGLRRDTELATALPVCPGPAVATGAPPGAADGPALCPPPGWGHFASAPR